MRRVVHRETITASAGYRATKSAREQANRRQDAGHGTLSGRSPKAGQLPTHRRHQRTERTHHSGRGCPPCAVLSPAQRRGNGHNVDGASPPYPPSNDALPEARRDARARSSPPARQAHKCPHAWRANEAPDRQLATLLNAAASPPPPPVVRGARGPRAAAPHPDGYPRRPHRLGCCGAGPPTAAGSKLWLSDCSCGAIRQHNLHRR